MLNSFLEARGVDDIWLIKVGLQLCVWRPEVSLCIVIVTDFVLCPFCSSTRPGVTSVVNWILSGIRLDQSLEVLDLLSTLAKQMPASIPVSKLCCEPVAVEPWEWRVGLTLSMSVTFIDAFCRTGQRVPCQRISNNSDVSPHFSNRLISFCGSLITD